VERQQGWPRPGPSAVPTVRRQRSPTWYTSLPCRRPASRPQGIGADESLVTGRS